MRIKKCKPCGEESPYWNWMESRGLTDFNNETLIAESIKDEPSMELSAALDAINDGAEETMTPQERRAFQLVVREGMTHERAARKMKIDKSVVTRHVGRAIKKVRILAMIRLPIAPDENVTIDENALEQ
jgi:predicted DNA-binding protein (UPF0251 family)